MEQNNGYQYAKGASSLGHIAPDILFVTNPHNQFTDIDNNLTLSSEQKLNYKKGLLSEIVRMSDISGTQWAKYYEAIAFLKENDWFWKTDGHADFDTFWQSHTGDGFKAWAELESMYNFAKIACPELFTITKSEAQELYRELEKLRTLPPSAPVGRPRKVFATENEAKQRILEVATTRISGQSLEKRFARLRRDAPEIAARFLQGEFLRKTTAGLLYIDMASAERIAYGESTRAEKRSQNRVKNAVRVLGAIKEDKEARLIVRSLKQNPTFAPYLKTNVGQKCNESSE